MRDVLVFDRGGPGVLRVSEPPPPVWRVVQPVERGPVWERASLYVGIKTKDYRLERWTMPAWESDEWAGWCEPGIRYDRYACQWRTIFVYRPVE